MYKRKLFFFFQAEDGIRDFCLSRGLGDVYKRQPDMVTTFSASLARSYRRGASPETVSFPAAAIQLSARIALLRRAKARWILFGGSPALCSRAEPGRLGAPGSAHWQSAPGGWGRSICKSAPNTDVADALRLVRWKLLLTLGLPGRALCLLFCRFLCGLLLPELCQLPLIFRLKFRCLPRIHACLLYTSDAADE